MSREMHGEMSFDRAEQPTVYTVPVTFKAAEMKDTGEGYPALG